ncbi:spermine oxidase isoform X2 [Bacillus rossius redtenbacheri]|uniref:spermine oxidase isoform X2 n=1 Tax=Bacillus rossius redtenbacheri TaxID=93214 RepID=UPI002FDECAB5
MESLTLKFWKQGDVLEVVLYLSKQVLSVTGCQRVELGANWIHGVLGNPMYELAMANGLIDIVHIPKPHRVVASTEQGKQIPFHLLQEIYEAYVCFLRRCEEYFLSNYLPPAGVNSVGQHINLEVALFLQHAMEGDAEKRHLSELIFDCLLKRETCITGCHSMDEIDLLELGSYSELQGGNIVLPSGYSSILSPVTRDIPADRIVCRCAVAAVRWRADAFSSHLASPGGDSGIELLANGDVGNESDDSDETVKEEPLAGGGEEPPGDVSEPRKVKGDPSTSNSLGPPANVVVECEDGRRFLADHVICTVPLGVLKEKAATLFSPPLPRYKLDSIDRLLFGTVDKIILEYDRPFLNPDISEVMLLWEKHDYDEDSLDDDLSKCWFRKIYSFSKLSDTLLLGWISGKEAEYMEKLSLEEVGDKCTEILRMFLNDPFVPKPKRCICTSWFSQPFTRGSYTAMAVGACQEDIENIAQPVYSSPTHRKPTLLFAGEHTHSSFYSTVHGAYLTGRTAAQMLVGPDSPEETVMECEGTSDLSSWIQGISLD